MFTVIAGVMIFSSKEYDSDDFRNSFEELTELNDLLISNRNILTGENDLAYISENVTGAKSLILKLRFNLDLCEIEYYNLDNGNTFGIAYKFVCNSDKYYFMLYINNPLFREDFVSYEQLCDFSDESENVTEKWTYRRINIFYE